LITSTKAFANALFLLSTEMHEQSPLRMGLFWGLAMITHPSHPLRKRRQNDDEYNDDDNNDDAYTAAECDFKYFFHIHIISYHILSWRFSTHHAYLFVDVQPTCRGSTHVPLASFRVTFARARAHSNATPTVVRQTHISCILCSSHSSASAPV